MKKQGKGRQWLAWMLSGAMAVTLMPTMAFAAGSEASYNAEATVQTSGDKVVYGSYQAKLLVKVNEDGSISSVEDNGTEPDANSSFWNSAKGMFSKLEGLKKSQIDAVDVVGSATVSSTAIKEAVKSVLPDDAAQSETNVFGSGTGTAEDPYIIQTVDQLQAFAKAVDGGESYEGKTVALGTDLDLSSITNWNPIGAESGNTANLFNGTFDGQDHTISGMKINGIYTEANYTDANVGFFSTLGGNAIVQNLTVSDFNIVANSNVKVRAGAIAGDAAAGTPVVNSVNVSGSVKTTPNKIMGMAGGILGRMSKGASLYNSVADVTVTSAAMGEEGLWGYAGGLTAMTGNGCVIANSTAHGTVSGTAIQGGAVGMITGTINNVYTDVTLSGSASESGAIAGQTMASGEYVYYTGTAEPFGTVTMGEVSTASVSSTAADLAATLTENLDKITSSVELKTWGVGDKGYAVPGAEMEKEDAEYVLMNIPYADFYAAEDGAVDSVTSATKNGKARNVNVNGASYHQSEAAVTEEGIAGAMYPVKVESLNDLKELGGREVTDADTLSYEMSARGQTSTVELKGVQVLQESPSYSYYVLSEKPDSYKELTVTGGKASFGKATGTPTTGEATGEAAIGGIHADVEIPLSGFEVAAADVSGVTITTDKGTYALHHVVNIWRGTEIGWNLSDMDLGGQTITKIRYFLKDGSIKDYTVNIPISSAGFVLMNIPYADFYKAELGENDAAVDAVTSSTLNKPRTGTLAGGSYHKNADGSDISGVIYPVFVKDLSQLTGLTQITDDSSVTISVTNTNRGTTTETTYTGKDALFESADYSYYKLTEKPARYKVMDVADGTKSFGAVNGRATTVEGASGEVNEAGHHAEVEIKLSNTTGIEQGQAVSGAVVTFEDGSKVGLRHITELWRATEIGGSAAQFADKKIKSIRYYTQDSVIDFPMEISVKKKAAAATAEFTDANTIQITGLPADLENAKATVQSRVGRGETPTVIAEDVEIKDGVITTTEAAVDGTTYTVAVKSDNYLQISAEALYDVPSAGDDFLSQLVGEYQPLFEGATLNSEYDHYWHDYTAAVVGESAADDTVAYVKGSINAKGYGENNDAPNFFCGFTNDVATITFGGEDGRTVTFTKKDGSSVTHTYDYVKEADATGKYGEYDMAMSGYLYKAKEEPADEFQYLLMFPDTPDTTYHLEFRYGGTEEDVLNLLDGPYAYWVGSAIQTSALTEEDEDTLQKVISLFVVENLAANETEETNTQRSGLAGTWDCDFSAFPEYANAKMYIVLSGDGKGKTYADFTGSGEPALVSEYTFFAYDPDKSDGKNGGTYIALNPDEETVTPGEYEITKINGKKALVFTSNEGVITYYLRDEQPSGGGTPSGSGSVTPSYKVTVPAQTSNGSVSASLGKAKKGDTVTITVTPEEGYQPDAVMVKDKDGNAVEVKDNGDGTYTFTMPASDVSVEASFKEKSEEPTPPAPHENCPSEPFKDVDTSLWYHEGIDYVIEKGMMNGVASDAFAPDDTTTRAMIVTILYRLEGEPAAEAASFKDVEAGSWYEAAVNWAAANGIVNGYDADTFAPTDQITREQMAAILYRYANFKGQDVSGQADLGRFTDSSAVSEYAQTAMAWAVNAELINGMTETTLVPQGSATRAQVATLMMRLCENILK